MADITAADTLSGNPPKGGYPERVVVEYMPPIAVNLAAADIQIGAVELKDGTTDTRAVVKTDGTNNALVVTQNSVPLATGAATSANQSTMITAAGGVTETAPATDTASSGLNGRLQRIAQRLTTILASTLGFSVGTGTVDATTLRVVTASDGTLNTNIGAVTETAPATDTASSGLNGRLQRIAQRLTSLIAFFKTEDSASADGDSGLPILAIRKATPVNTSGTDGDYETLQVSTGHLWTYADGGIASGATDSGNPVKVGGKYNSSAPTLTDGQRGDFQLDVNANQKLVEQKAPAAEDNTNAVIAIANKPLAVSTYAPSSSTSTANETSRVAKASAGVLYRINGYNAKITAQFIQIHNAASLPADTAVPVITFTVPASSNFSIEFGMMGRYFSTGITVCNSSTQATKAIGSADCWFDVLYQ